MTEAHSAERRKVTGRDVGKPVVTPSGRRVGRVDSVAGTGAFTVALASEGGPYVGEGDDVAEDPVSAFPPEALELVTPTRVWLRV